MIEWLRDELAAGDRCQYSRYATRTNRDPLLPSLQKTRNTVSQLTITLRGIVCIERSETPTIFRSLLDLLHETFMSGSTAFLDIPMARSLGDPSGVDLEAPFANAISSKLNPMF